MSLSVNNLQKLTSRLVEHFCVVGLSSDLSFEVDPETPLSPSTPTNIEKYEDQTFKVEVLDRYPLTDRKNGEIDFPESIRIFCHPEGLRLSTHAEHPIFFSFVQTGVDGSRMYGYVFTFHEILTEEQRTAFNQIARSSQPDTEISDVQAEMSQEYYITKSLCILSAWPFFQEFRQWLMNIYTMSLSATAIPIERYICNFVEEVPCPQAGKCEVRYSLGPSVEITFRCPPNNDPTAWETFPFSLLFECLDCQNILQFFTAILLERQVLVVSSCLSPLTICTEAIMSLLYPLVWPCIYVPLCPTSLLGVMKAPSPWIVGTKREFLTDNVEVPLDAVRVDLDNNTVDPGSLGDLPQLPSPALERLQEALEGLSHLFTERDADWKTTTLPHMDWALNLTARPNPHEECSKKSSDQKQKQLDLQSTWAAIRQMFLCFFVSIFKDYRKFFVEASGSEDMDWNFFQHEQFVQSHPRDWQFFVSQVVLTQTFAMFIDSRVDADVEDQDFVFFEEATKSAPGIRGSGSFLPRKVGAPGTPRRVASPRALKGNQRARVDHTRTVIPETPNSEGIDCQFLESIMERADWILDTNSRPNPDEAPRGQSPAKKFWKTPKFSQSTTRLRLIEPLLIRYQGRWPRLMPELYSQPRPYAGIKLLSTEKRGNQASRGNNTLFARDSREPGTASDVVHGLWLWAFANTVGRVDIRIPASYSGITQSQSEKNMFVEILPSPLPQSFSPPKIQTDGKTLKDYKSKRRLLVKSYRQASKGGVEFHEACSASLEVLVDVLRHIRAYEIRIEPSIFRALLVAAGRAGDSEKALQIMHESEQAGYKADAAIRTSMAISLIQASRKDAPRTKKDFFEMLRAGSSLDFHFDSRYHEISPTPSDVSDSSPSNKGVLKKLRRRFNMLTSRELLLSNEFEKRLGPIIPSSVFPASVHQQIEFGQHLLKTLYSSLNLDTNRESCPTCQKMLSLSDIRQGWKIDVNVYTTACPFCTAGLLPEESGTKTKQASPSPVEFVPRFSVECSNDNWEGTMGKGTPLFCEYLSPWVLRKELYRIIVENGPDILLDPHFAEKTKITATIFWNLIVHFTEFNLPITFLLIKGLTHLQLLSDCS